MRQAFAVSRNQNLYLAIEAAALCQRRTNMKKLLVVAMLAAFVTPTLAADEFYGVQDVKTKKCTIVDKKPTTTTVTQVGPVTFKTRQEAESGMKTIKVCESH
jgi:hypothetical protein